MSFFRMWLVLTLFVALNGTQMTQICMIYADLLRSIPVGNYFYINLEALFLIFHDRSYPGIKPRG